VVVSFSAMRAGFAPLTPSGEVDFRSSYSGRCLGDEKVRVLRPE
jgi:hypothetical protein